MWRRFEGLLQKVDESFPPIVGDLLLVAFAATLITIIVRSLVV